MTTHVADGLEQLRETDELGLDRLPGMPMLGLLAGTVFSLAIWGAVALIAWGFTA